MEGIFGRDIWKGYLVGRKREEIDVLANHNYTAGLTGRATIYHTMESKYFGSPNQILIHTPTISLLSMRAIGVASMYLFVSKIFLYSNTR